MAIKVSLPYLPVSIVRTPNKVSSQNEHKKARYKLSFGGMLSLATRNKDNVRPDVALIQSHRYVIFSVAYQHIVAFRKQIGFGQVVEGAGTDCGSSANAPAPFVTSCDQRQRINFYYIVGKHTRLKRNLETKTNKK